MLTVTAGRVGGVFCRAAAKALRLPHVPRDFRPLFCFTDVLLQVQRRLEDAEMQRVAELNAREQVRTRSCNTSVFTVR